APLDDAVLPAGAEAAAWRRRAGAPAAAPSQSPGRLTPRVQGQVAIAVRAGAPAPCCHSLVRAEPLLAVISASLDGRTEFEVRGELDLATVEIFRTAVDGALHDTDGDVLIDLSQLAFMASPGLHALLRARRQLELGGRRLLVICPPGLV